MLDLDIIDMESTSGLPPPRLVSPEIITIDDSIPTFRDFDNSYPTWIDDFTKKCIDLAGSKCLKRLDKLMEFYLVECRRELEFCNRSPGRAYCVAKAMYRSITFFYMYFQDVRDFFVTTQYNETIVELLSIYCKLELRSAQRINRGKENDNMISTRIMNLMWVTLEHSEQHMIHVLLKMAQSGVFTRRHRDMYGPIFRKLLTYRRPKVCSDTEYISIILAYKAWKRVMYKNEKKGISDMALRMVRTPKNFERNYCKYTKFLPRYEGSNSQSVHEYLITTMFELTATIEGYFNYLEHNQNKNAAVDHVRLGKIRFMSDFSATFSTEISHDFSELDDLSDACIPLLNSIKQETEGIHDDEDDVIIIDDAPCAPKRNRNPVLVEFIDLTEEDDKEETEPPPWVGRIIPLARNYTEELFRARQFEVEVVERVRNVLTLNKEDEGGEKVNEQKPSSSAVIDSTVQNAQIENKFQDSEISGNDFPVADMGGNEETMPISVSTLRNIPDQTEEISSNTDNVPNNSINTEALDKIHIIDTSEEGEDVHSSGNSDISSTKSDEGSNPSSPNYCQIADEILSMNILTAPPDCRSVPVCNMNSEQLRTSEQLDTVGESSYMSDSADKQSDNTGNVNFPATNSLNISDDSTNAHSSLVTSDKKSVTVFSVFEKAVEKEDNTSMSNYLDKDIKQENGFSHGPDVSMVIEEINENEKCHISERTDNNTKGSSSITNDSSIKNHFVAAETNKNPDILKNFDESSTKNILFTSKENILKTAVEMSDTTKTIDCEEKSDLKSKQEIIESMHKSSENIDTSYAIKYSDEFDVLHTSKAEETCYISNKLKENEVLNKLEKTDEKNTINKCAATNSLEKMAEPVFEKSEKISALPEKNVSSENSISDTSVKTDNNNMSDVVDKNDATDESDIYVSEDNDISEKVNVSDKKETSDATDISNTADVIGKNDTLAEVEKFEISNISRELNNTWNSHSEFNEALLDEEDILNDIHVEVHEEIINENEILMEIENEGLCAVVIGNVCGTKVPTDIISDANELEPIMNEKNVLTSTEVSVQTTDDLNVDISVQNNNGAPTEKKENLNNTNEKIFDILEDIQFVENLFKSNNEKILKLKELNNKDTGDSKEIINFKKKTEKILNDKKTEKVYHDFKNKTVKFTKLVEKQNQLLEEASRLQELKQSSLEENDSLTTKKDNVKSKKLSKLNQADKTKLSNESSNELKTDSLLKVKKAKNSLKRKSIIESGITQKNTKEKPLTRKEKELMAKEKNFTLKDKQKKEKSLKSAIKLDSLTSPKKEKKVRFSVDNVCFEPDKDLNHTNKCGMDYHENKMSKKGECILKVYKKKVNMGHEIDEVHNLKEKVRDKLESILKKSSKFDKDYEQISEKSKNDSVAEENDRENSESNIKNPEEYYFNDNNKKKTGVTKKETQLESILKNASFRELICNGEFQLEKPKRRSNSLNTNKKENLTIGTNVNLHVSVESEDDECLAERIKKRVNFKRSTSEEGSTTGRNKIRNSGSNGHRKLDPNLAKSAVLSNSKDNIFNNSKIVVKLPSKSSGKQNESIEKDKRRKERFRKEETNHIKPEIKKGNKKQDENKELVDVDNSFELKKEELIPKRGRRKKEKDNNSSVLDNNVNKDDEINSNLNKRLRQKSGNNTVETNKRLRSRADATSKVSEDLSTESHKNIRSNSLDKVNVEENVRKLKRILEIPKEEAYRNAKKLRGRSESTERLNKFEDSKENLILKTKVVPQNYDENNDYFNRKSKVSEKPRFDQEEISESHKKIRLKTDYIDKHDDEIDKDSVYRKEKKERRKSHTLNNHNTEKFKAVSLGNDVCKVRIVKDHADTHDIYDENSLIDSEICDSISKNSSFLRSNLNISSEDLGEVNIVHGNVCATPLNIIDDNSLLEDDVIDDVTELSDSGAYGDVNSVISPARTDKSHDECVDDASDISVQCDDLDNIQVTVIEQTIEYSSKDGSDLSKDMRNYLLGIQETSVPTISNSAFEQFVTQRSIPHHHSVDNMLKTSTVNHSSVQTDESIPEEYDDDDAVSAYDSSIDDDITQVPSQQRSQLSASNSDDETDFTDNFNPQTLSANRITYADRKRKLDTQNAQTYESRPSKISRFDENSKENEASTSYSPPSKIESRPPINRVYSKNRTKYGRWERYLMRQFKFDSDDLKKLDIKIILGRMDSELGENSVSSQERRRIIAKKMAEEIPKVASKVTSKQVPVSNVEQKPDPEDIVSEDLRKLLTGVSSSSTIIERQDYTKSKTQDTQTLRARIERRPTTNTKVKFADAPPPPAPSTSNAPATPAVAKTTKKRGSTVSPEMDILNSNLDLLSLNGRANAINYIEKPSCSTQSTLCAPCAQDLQEASCSNSQQETSSSINLNDPPVLEEETAPYVCNVAADNCTTLPAVENVSPPTLCAGEPASHPLNVSLPTETPYWDVNNGSSNADLISPNDDQVAFGLQPDNKALEFENVYRNNCYESPCTSPEHETHLPIKKRRVSSLKVINKDELRQDFISDVREEISYPSTPMISIAELENIKTPGLKFKTPGELKEIPPLTQPLPQSLSQPYASCSPSQVPPPPLQPYPQCVAGTIDPVVQLDQPLSINHTYNNPTINYHIGSSSLVNFSYPTTASTSYPPLINPLMMPHNAGDANHWGQPYYANPVSAPSTKEARKRGPRNTRNKETAARRGRRTRTNNSL